MLSISEIDYIVDDYDIDFAIWLWFSQGGVHVTAHIISRSVRARKPFSCAARLQNWTATQADLNLCQALPAV